MIDARSRGRGRATSRWLVLLISLSCPFVPAQPSFHPPEPLTDGSEIFQLSRNPDHTMGFDSQGRLHVVYWSGSFATRPGQPSFVYYQNWSPAEGWSPSESIDDSYFTGGSEPVKFGGRHPSLAITPEDTVWVAWHDHRHCNPDPPGNGIDNIEIYADRRPRGGTFSTSDIRLTETAAGHLGDNGYMARVAASPSGRVSVLWYDFHENGNVSDIFATHSDSTGDFGAIEPILSLRLTDQNDRPGAGFTKESFSMPDVAVSPSGELAVIWTSGFGGVSPIYFADVPLPPAIVRGSAVASDAGAYFDPAKITWAPNGDLWIVYTRITGGEEDLAAIRRRAGNSLFDAPIVLKATAGVTESAADLEVDAAGILHLAWVDERAGRQVVYARFDPEGPGLLEEYVLTRDPRPYQRVSLALDASGNPHFLFDSVEATSGDIWFVAPAQLTGVSGWTAYQ